MQLIGIISLDYVNLPPVEAECGIVMSVANKEAPSSMMNAQNERWGIKRRLSLTATSLV